MHTHRKWAPSPRSAFSCSCTSSTYLCLPSHLPTYLLAYPLTYLLTYLLAYLLACLLTYLRAYPLTYLLTCKQNLLTSFVDATRSF